QVWPMIEQDRNVCRLAPGHERTQPLAIAARVVRAVDADNLYSYATQFDTARVVAQPAYRQATEDCGADRRGIHRRAAAHCEYRRNHGQRTPQGARVLSRSLVAHIRQVDQVATEQDEVWVERAGDTEHLLFAPAEPLDVDVRHVQHGHSFRRFIVAHELEMPQADGARLQDERANDQQAAR